MAYGETYEEFVDKFKPRKTTDDCYTPPLVYEAVKDWAVNEYGLQGLEIVRPFYPGGDYEHYDYPENCIVIDNPPFSILAKIRKFYVENSIRFFLFAPSLTLFVSFDEGINYVVVKGEITYENGAEVDTSFVTSEGDWFIRTAPGLEKAISEANEAIHSTSKRPKYVYPDNLVCCSSLRKISCVDFRLKREDCSSNLVRALDSQRKSKKGIYGSGYLISDAKAAELKAAELKAAELKAAELKAAGEKIEWKLSERELAIIEQLNKNTAD